MKRKRFDGPSLHVKMTKEMREAVTRMATKNRMDDSEFIRIVLESMIMESEGPYGEFNLLSGLKKTDKMKEIDKVLEDLRRVVLVDSFND